MSNKLFFFRNNECFVYVLEFPDEVYQLLFSYNTIPAIIFKVKTRLHIPHYEDQDALSALAVELFSGTKSVAVKSCQPSFVGKFIPCFNPYSLFSQPGSKPSNVHKNNSCLHFAISSSEIGELADDDENYVVEVFKGLCFESYSIGSEQCSADK